MRVEEGGFGNIQGNSFAVKQSPVTPISVSGLKAPEITQMFSFLPEGSLVSQSGAAHQEAGKILGDIADALVTHVQVLNENWGGTAAQNAVTNFSQLHETAVGLAQASTQTGAVLTWLGGILPAYKSFTAANSTAGDADARAAMNELNGNLVEANSNLPTTITKNLPANSAGGSSSTVGAAAGGVAAGSAAAGASPGGGPGGASAGGTGGTGTPSAPGGGGGTAGISPGTGTTGTTSPGTSLAGIPPGGGGTAPGTGTGAPVPGGAPGGNPGGTPGPDPIGSVPPPSTTAPGDPVPGDPGPGGAPGAAGPEPAGAPPGDGADPLPAGSAPGAGDPPGLGGVPGDGADPLPAGSFPGGGDPGPAGGVPGDGTDPGGFTGMPGDGADPVPVGSLPGGAGGFGGPAGAGGSGPGGRPGLTGEDIVGDPAGDSAVVGPDGMIGTGPGGLGEGMESGFAEGGAGVGNSGATGFVGADDAVTGPVADSAGNGIPASGAPGSGQEHKERRRQAWMSEDADLWEGSAEHVPSHIGA